MKENHMNWKIPLSDLNFGPEEAQAVQKVIESRWLTMGAVTQDFERAFEQYNQARHAVAVTNCTAALHLACLAVGLGPGDEAIVPSLSFVATANAVRYTGAAPVFADIESLTDLNISPAAIEEKITPRTKAIVVMHYGGYPCNMPAILQLARRHGLRVIEDAAHAAGSTLEGRRLGCWGDIGCFSFFSNKNMTTGEGGMLVTAHDTLAESLRLMRSHGMTTLTWDRHQGHARGYDVVALGYNYRIDEIRSALGLVQLTRLDEGNARRRELTALYRSTFEEMLPDVILPFFNYRGVSAAHILPVLLPSGMEREKISETMKSQGIQTSHHYPPIHLFSTYRDGENGGAQTLPVTEKAAERQMTLPLYPAMTDQDVISVVSAMREAFSKA